MVQYQVMYHYIHPTSRKVCTNLSTGKYDLNTRFIKVYPTKDGINTADVLFEQSADNAKYDMLFIYDGVQELNQLLGDQLIPSATVPHIVSEKFQRCKGEGFFVASNHASLQAAITASEPLVRSIGKDNVKVVKIVPLAITIGLE